MSDHQYHLILPYRWVNICTVGNNNVFKITKLVLYASFINDKSKGILKPKNEYFLFFVDLS